MRYSTIIADMTWSFSRLKAFEDCPYRWLMKYIKPVQQKSLFFSDYGKYMHSLIEKYLKGYDNRVALASQYRIGFSQHVCGKAPSPKVFASYFNDGYAYLRNIYFPYQEILSLEEKGEFTLDGVKFVAIPDIIATDNGIVIADNKARKLQPRSTRKKPTRTDEELDDYLRQLYLYSIRVYERFGEYPVHLDFNCYRSQELIQEPFDKQVFEKTKDWARRKVDEIIENDDWSPKLDYFKCRYLCDVSDSCEYFQMIQRRGI